MQWWKKIADQAEEDEKKESFRRQKEWLAAELAKCKDPKRRKVLQGQVDIFRMCSGGTPSMGQTTSAPAVVTAASLEPAVFALMWPSCIPVAPAKTCTDRAALVYFDNDANVVGVVNFGGQRGSRTGDFTPVKGVIDDHGQLHITGQTSDPALPVKNPVQAGYRASADGFVLTLQPATGDTSFVSYLGGGSFDTVTDMAVDADGNRWIVGYTQSADFPVTRSGVQPEMRGRIDSFVVKISP